jgi:hypothetical protein
MWPPEDRELQRALAKASLRAGWVQAEASGLSGTGAGEIVEEIHQIRSGLPETIRNGVTVLSPTDYLAHLVGE